MAFNISGTTITQTGTDTSLVGLAGLAGVTTIAQGAGGSGVTIYNIGNNRLQINGVLTHDPEIERVVTGTTAPTPAFRVGATGTYNLGIAETINGFTRYSDAVAWHISRPAVGWTTKDIEIDGTINWNGGAIKVGNGILFSATCTGTINYGRIHHHDHALASPIEDVIASANLVINDFGLIGGGTQLFNVQPTVNGFAPTFYNGIFPSGFGTGSTTFLRIDNYRGNGTYQDHTLWRRNLLELRNAELGSQVEARGKGSGTTEVWKNTGILMVTSDFVLNVTGDQVGALQGARYFIRDYNNGNRRDTSSEPAGCTGAGVCSYAVGFDNIPDKTYTGVSDFTGACPSQNVVLKIQDQTDPNLPTDTLVSDYRTKYNDANRDIFDIYVYEYNNLLYSQEINLKGIGEKNFTVTLKQDVRVTNQDPLAVSFYTEINDSEQLYDYCKYLKVQPDGFEAPSPLGMLLTADGSTLTIPAGWSLVRNQSITNAVEINTASNEIRVKTGTGGLLATNSFDTFSGTVSGFGIDDTDMQYIVTPNQTNLRVNGLISGTSISVLNGATEVAEDIQVAGTSTEITFPYTSDFNATILYMCDGYQMSQQAVIINEGIVNITAPILNKSYGQVDTIRRIRNVDGVNIGLGENAFIDADTTAKTFDVISAASSRTVMTAIMQSWDEPELNDIIQPCVVDDVRGLSINDGWDFTPASINSFMKDEGYVKRDSNGAVIDFKYCIHIEDNPIDVQYEIYYGQFVGQGVQTINPPAGGSGDAVNTLIDIDHTQSEVSIRIKAKHPQYNFKIVYETIIQSGVIVSDRFKMQTTNYAVSVDPSVFTDESANLDIDFSHISGATTQTDSNGIDRTFSLGELRLRAGTRTLSDVISQLAAIAAGEFHFNTKLYELVGTTQININKGYYVTVAGAPLSGALRGIVNLYDDNETKFATPEFRSIALNVPTDWEGVDIEYVVITDDVNVLSGNPTVETDADGVEMRGTLTPSALPTILTQELSTDKDVRIIWGAAGVEIGQHAETLDSDGITYSINPVNEVVKLYADENQIIDDLDAGTKGYYPGLENIIIESSTRRFIIPNEIKACELSYVYRAWRDWIEADFDRLKYGIAWVGSNQSKQAGSTNNAHLFNPNWFISFAWRVDVLSSRNAVDHGLVEFQASDIGRYDEIHGFAQQNSGVVYASPMANSEPPVLKIIVGFTTEALTNINNKLAVVQDAVISSGIELKATDRAMIQDIPNAETITDHVLEINNNIDDNETKIDALGVKIDNSRAVIDSNANNIGTVRSKTDNLPNNTESVLSDIKTEVDSHPTLAEIEASAVLAKASVLSSVESKVDEIKTETDYMDRKVYINEELVDTGNGSFSSPYNNIGNALDYAELNGIKKLIVLSDVTLDRNLKNFEVTGIGRPIVDINGNNVDKSEFYRVELRGASTGSIVAEQCLLGDNLTLYGHYFNCGLKANLVCNNNSDVLLAQCTSVIAGLNRPELSLNPAGTSQVSIRGYSGGLLVKDVNQSTDNITLEISQGKIELHNTCTNGVISVRGICSFTDNSNGSTVDKVALGATLSNASEFKDGTSVLNGLDAKVDTIDSVVDAIKETTDKLNFIGDDIKATLDGEEVVTDIESRQASRADITKIEDRLDNLPMN